MLQEGEKFPEFNLPDQDGNACTLKDFAGKWLLLYLYPKDDTPGCTKEACAFRDDFDKYRQRGIEVVGLSPDSAKKHGNFIKKHDLPFKLLTDADKSFVDSLGAYGEKKFMGRTYMGVFRESFLIDPDGILKKHYSKVKPEGHSIEILEDFDTFTDN